MNQSLNLIVTQMRDQSIGYERAVVLFRRQYVLNVLTECRGNQCLTATMLGIHRNTLGRHLAELNIDTEDVKRGLRKQGFRFRRAKSTSEAHL
jgi:Fis family transcriptional regulator, factor for inversion stimulation protein